jgi:SAM-dependent methyltransferase
LKEILTGYDLNGAVYDTAGYILRRIYPHYINDALSIYDMYKKNNLEQHGIVETELDQFNKTLRHKKHIISYPYEWPANMYKDAVLFHLGLFAKLDGCGLALKDAAPNNILFDFQRPVFVDFLSMVRKEKLKDEASFLPRLDHPDARFGIFSKMFIPFMLTPLIDMAEGDYGLARYSLSEKACNSVNSGFSALEGFHKMLRLFKLRSKRTVKYLLGKGGKLRFDAARLAVIKNLLKAGRNTDFVDFVQIVYECVKDVEVTPLKSRYASYYEDKNENYDLSDRSQWKDKQKNIYDIIRWNRPGRVMDIGANTGWFSILAEKLGSEVIAVDADESSIDALYRDAKARGLKILPLLIPFSGLTRQIYGIVDDHPAYKDRDFKNNPLFTAPTKRLKADMVLCLGLFHHLVLGEGREIDAVFKVLSDLTAKTLILEFVSMEDSLIQSEPAAFKNIKKFNETIYNLRLILEKGKRYFMSVETRDSYPASRKLLIFGK